MQGLPCRKEIYTHKHARAHINMCVCVCLHIMYTKLF